MGMALSTHNLNQQGQIRATRFSIAFFAIVVMGGLMARQMFGHPVTADALPIAPQPIAVYGTIQQISGSTLSLNDGSTIWSFAVSPATKLRRIDSSSNAVTAGTIDLTKLAKGETVSITFDANSTDRPMMALDLDVLETK